jgi:hypothetical protein
VKGEVENCRMLEVTGITGDLVLSRSGNSFVLTSRLVVLETEIGFPCQTYSNASLVPNLEKFLNERSRQQLEKFVGLKTTLWTDMRGRSYVFTGWWDRDPTRRRLMGSTLNRKTIVASDHVAHR